MNGRKYPRINGLWRFLPSFHVRNSSLFFLQHQGLSAAEVQSIVQTEKLKIGKKNRAKGTDFRTDYAELYSDQMADLSRKSSDAPNVNLEFVLRLDEPSEENPDHFRLWPILVISWFFFDT